MKHIFLTMVTSLLTVLLSSWFLVHHYVNIPEIQSGHRSSGSQADITELDDENNPVKPQFAQVNGRLQDVTQALRQSDERISITEDRLLDLQRVLEDLQISLRKANFESPGVAPMSEEQILANSEQTLIFNDMEERHSTEDFDTAWEQQVAADLDHAKERFSQFGMDDSSIVYQDCRTTVCRIKLEVKGGSALDLGILPVILGLKNVSGLTTQVDPATGRTVLLYQR